MKLGGFDWMRLRIALVTAAIGLQGVLAFAPTAAGAADPNNPSGELNLVTSPLPISLVAKPGATVTADVRVKNAGVSTERLKVGLLKFDAYGDEGKPRLLDFAPQDSYSKWVTFSQTTFDARPNVWNTIKMTVTLPKSAAFGYYYAVTFSRAASERADGSRQTTIKGSTAVLVLLEANVPNARREIAVADFTSKKGVYEFLPSSFGIRLHNSGNVHLAPRGNIFIIQGKNKTISTIEVNPELGNVLPNSNRIFESDWTDVFPHFAPKEQDGKRVLDAKGQPVSELKWNFNDIGKIRFGKYTANLLLVYDDGKRDVPIEAQLSFWVIPWRFLLVATILVGLVGLGVWSMLGNVRRSLGRGRSRRR